MSHYNKEVSIAKGIGIIAVVSGHIVSLPQPFPFHPSTFHMPLFFFLSGLFFRPHDGLARFIGRRARSLLVPYFAYNLLFGLLTWQIWKHAGIDLGNADHWWHPRVFLLEPFISGNQYSLFLVGWFICSLFIIQCLYKLLFPAVRYCGDGLATGFFFLLALTAVLGGMDHPVFEPGYLVKEIVLKNLFGLFYYHLGHVYADQQVDTRIFSINGLIFFTLLQYWSSTRLEGRVVFEMVWNRYHSLSAPFIGPLCGIYVVMYLSRLLARQSGRYNPIEIIGNSSLHIMVWHLSIFLVINLLFIAYQGQSPQILQNNFWYTYHVNTTWPLYLGLGVGIPTLIHIRITRWLRTRQSQPTAHRIPM